MATVYAAANGAAGNRRGVGLVGFVHRLRYDEAPLAR